MTATCSRCRKLRHDCAIYASSGLFSSDPSVARVHTNTILCNPCHDLVLHK